jgi:hypothetical protein
MVVHQTMVHYDIVCYLKLPYNLLDVPKNYVLAKKALGKSS